MATGTGPTGLVGHVVAMLAGTRVKPPQLDEFVLAGEEALRRSELVALGLPPT